MLCIWMSHICLLLVYVYGYAYVCLISVCCLRASACTYVRAHVRVRMQMYVCVNVCTYVCTYLLGRTGNLGDSLIGKWGGSGKKFRGGPLRSSETSTVICFTKLRWKSGISVYVREDLVWSITSIPVVPNYLSEGKGEGEGKGRRKPVKSLDPMLSIGRERSPPPYRRKVKNMGPCERSTCLVRSLEK